MAYKVRVNASGIVKNGQGRLLAIIPNVGSAGNVSLYDALSDTGTPFAVVSAASGQPLFYTDEGVEFAVGLYATYSGAGDLTFIYE